MSRHYVFNGERAFVYGYDRPLRHYFFQVMLGNEIVHSDDCGGCTAAEVQEAAEAFGVTLPQEHVAALLLDLPISDQKWDGAAIDAAKFDAVMAEAEVNSMEEDPE